MFKQIGITALLVASASAACWSESQGKIKIIYNC